MNQNIKDELDAIYRLIRQETQDETRALIHQLQSDSDHQIEGLQAQISKYKAANTRLEAKCKSCESIKVNSLNTELEEMATSKSVLNHHCVNLKNHNSVLSELCNDKISELRDLRSKCLEQKQALLELTQKYDDLAKERHVADETIKKHESDLALFHHNYYYDVMNKNKSKNKKRGC